MKTLASDACELFFGLAAKGKTIGKVIGGGGGGLGVENFCLKDFFSLSLLLVKEFSFDRRNPLHDFFPTNLACGSLHTEYFSLIRFQCWIVDCCCCCCCCCCYYYYYYRYYYYFYFIFFGRILFCFGTPPYSIFGVERRKTSNRHCMEEHI